MRALRDAPATVPRSLDAAAGAADAADWRFLLPIDAASRILDLTGDDAVALALAGDVAGVVAVRATADAADELTREARRAGLRDLRTRVSRLRDLRLADGPFDVLVLHDALERDAGLRGAEAVTLLARLRRLLAPGGCLWLAGGSGGAGLGACRRALRTAGLVGRESWALLPDATRPREILPLGGSLARRLAPRIASRAGRPRVPDIVARSAIRLGLGGRMAPAWGVLARVPGGAAAGPAGPAEGGRR